jgi:hypothetical protein
MKVEELIELLKREDPKAEVIVRMTNGDYDIYEGPMLYAPNLLSSHQPKSIQIGNQMKVKELIELLKRENPESEVVVPVADDNYDKGHHNNAT